MPKMPKYHQDKRNANKGTDRGRAALKQSLERLGAGRSVLVDKHNVIIAGNKTMEAAEAIGMSDNTIVVETTGDKLVVVKRMDLDLEAKDVKAIEMSLADNRVAQLGLDFDLEILKTDLEMLQSDFLDELWTPDDLGELFKPESPVVIEDEPPIDKASELQAKWQVSPGDLWIIGEHRLICGDCTDKATVERLMGGEKAVLCCADPPYGMGKENDGIANDNLYREKLDAFQMAWWHVTRPHLTDNASAYIWGQAEDLWRLWYSGGLKDSERLTFRNEIVWDKKHGLGMSSDAHRMYPIVSERCLFFMIGEQGFNNNADNYWEGWEPIRAYLEQERKAMGWSIKQASKVAGTSGMAKHWFTKSQWEFPTEVRYKQMQAAANSKAFKREYDDLKREFYSTRAYFDNVHDNMTDVWDFKRVIGEERWEHATPKPVTMIARIIKSSCPEKDLITDPFLGSGTTMVAAHQTGRRCYGLEIAPGYCAVILERMSKLGLTTVKQ